MAPFCLRIIRLTDVCRKFHRRIRVLRRFVRLLWNKIRPCSSGKRRYRMLPRAATFPTPPVKAVIATEGEFPSDGQSPICRRDNGHRKSDSDLVSLKISLLGDQQIGKTSFLTKYVGDEKEGRWTQEAGINLVDKTLCVGNARISYSLWDLQGDGKFRDGIPMACVDSVAILFMFDLTSRCTLNSVIGWYQEARKWNQTAIPILVGTKFDDFIQLPLDLQWTIASQARQYAKALKATLFFSSATYNINVNKIFKFIAAKLFDLPWTVERNLTIGEPIIDF